MEYFVLDTETTLHDAFLLGMPDEKDKNRRMQKNVCFEIGAARWPSGGRKTPEFHDFLVEEIFCDKNLMKNAYFQENLPKYETYISTGKAEIKPWEEIIEIMRPIFNTSTHICAYNVNFDMRVLKFTDNYIKMKKQGEEVLNMWLDWNVKNKPARKNKRFNTENVASEFRFKNFKQIKVIDIWAMACEYLKSDPGYVKWLTPERLEGRTYWPTNAETIYAYLMGKDDFKEEHTALDDAIIENEIFLELQRRGTAIIEGVVYNPFLKLGKIRR